ncbi:MAG: hypothetical protein AB1696_08910 [Planctomycetota bacterium]
MKTVRRLLTLAFFLGLAYSAAYGSGTTKSEAEKMKCYPPGSSTAFRWVSVEEGVGEMEKLKMPGMIYYYNCNDRPSAYMWEVNLFDCSGKGLKDKLIIMRCDSTEKLDSAKTKDIRIPKGKTGVLFVDFKGKKIKDVSRPPSPSLFHRVVRDVVEANNKAIKEAEANKEGEKKDAEKKEGDKKAADKKAADKKAGEAGDKKDDKEGDDET